MGGSKAMSATCWALALRDNSAEVIIRESVSANTFLVIHHSLAKRVRYV
jgi:hypothetical protein